MSDADDRLAKLTRRRREPPPLRPVTVVARTERSSGLLRLTFRGDGLDGLLVEPAASVRLLVPSTGVADLVLPEWNGNEFLLPDGERPALRTFTPLRSPAGTDHLDIEVVRHPGGAVSEWAERVADRADAAFSGPGSGYEFDGSADRLLVFGDETAVPAISQLFEWAPHDQRIDAVVEIGHERAVVEMPARSDDTLEWRHADRSARIGDQLRAAVSQVGPVSDTTRIWAAGEAATMQAIRTHLFDELGVDRTAASIRGYWKPSRAT